MWSGSLFSLVGRGWSVSEGAHGLRGTCVPQAACLNCCEWTSPRNLLMRTPDVSGGWSCCLETGPCFCPNPPPPGGASLVTPWSRICLPVEETRVQSLGQESPLEKETITHSSILVWEIPRTEVPGRHHGVAKGSDTTERLHNNNPHQAVSGTSRLGSQGELESSEI